MQDTTETQFTHLIICYNIIIFSHRSFQLIQLKKKKTGFVCKVPFIVGVALLCWKLPGDHRRSWSVLLH